MDVISFLYVSLGSSVVQLHDSVGRRRVWACSDVGFSSQNGVHGLKRILPKSNVLLWDFLWAKALNAKDINKEMIPVFGGKCDICSVR
jgi:hypothetical protein